MIKRHSSISPSSYDQSTHPPPPLPWYNKHLQSMMEHFKVLHCFLGVLYYILYRVPALLQVLCAGARAKWRTHSPNCNIPVLMDGEWWRVVDGWRIGRNMDKHLKYNTWTISCLFLRNSCESFFAIFLFFLLPNNIYFFATYQQVFPQHPCQVSMYDR